jgi:hypothetical protein
MCAIPHRQHGQQPLASILLDWAVHVGGEFPDLLAGMFNFFTLAALRDTLPNQNTSIRTPPSVRNMILAGIPPAQLALLSPHLTMMELPQGLVLVKPGARIEYLYFLERGLASTDALSTTGRFVEVGVTGREGVVGFHALLGVPTVSHLVIMQGGGAGFRIPRRHCPAGVAKGRQLPAPLPHVPLFTHRPGLPVRALQPPPHGGRPSCPLAPHGLRPHGERLPRPDPGVPLPDAGLHPLHSHHSGRSATGPGPDSLQPRQDPHP